MRKLLLIVLSILFLLGMATKAEVENVKEEAEKEVVKSETSPEGGINEPLIKPEEEPALYKTSLNVQTPNEGITTGHVIAYGHYIKPPYKLEIREDTLLFLNGVRIYPKLPSMAAEEYSKRLEEEALKELNEEALVVYKRHQILFDEIQNVYMNVNSRKGREQAIDSVFKLLKEDTLVKVVDTVFGKTGGVLLGVDRYLPGIAQPWSSSISLDYSYKREARQKLSPYLKKRIKDRAKDEKVRIEEHLRKSKMVFCSSFNQAINTYQESDLWEVLGILESKQLSRNEKMDKLFLIASLGERESKQLIYNFTPSEWSSLKKIEE